MRSCAYLLLFVLSTVYAAERDVLVITVATEWNDALQRFLRSAEHNNFEVKILGLGEQWRGGDVSKYVGGGQKVKLLRDELRAYHDSDRLILFVDGYDVVFVDKKETLLKAYEKIGKTVLFGAEDFCWPQQSLEKLYPTVKAGEKRFLNSGGFMGPASHLYRIVTTTDIKDDDDDQLYYTNVFLNEASRNELDIGLDKTSAIFQNLHGAFSEIELRFTDATGYLYNTRTSTRPSIVHGNGPIKTEFNTLANYLDYTWTPTNGCQHCSEHNIDLNKPEEFPIIQMSLFVEQPTPFLDVFFERIAALTYPKNRIHLTGHIAKKAANQKQLVEAFNQTYGHEYRTSVWFNSDEVTDAGSAHDMAFAYCLAMEDCQFLFSVDATAQLTAPNTIEHLVHMNRSMLAPLLSRRGKLWSNFWGALSKDGYYDRSDDYVEIVEGRRVGIWNVPFIRDAYLLARSAVRKLVDSKFAGAKDVPMTIARAAREKNIFMTVDNQQNYGYLIYPDGYSTDHVNNDLWEIFNNPMDWEEKYVNPGYFEFARAETRMEDFAQPCPDVFWYPIVTEKFCKHLIEDMENYGMWSDGSNQDSRLEGGYENVPTRDIHMRQVDWEEHWLHFLNTYVHPIQRKLFQGYDDKPWARMNFVVRYRPDEQPTLRAHHDASSYTLVVALNEPEKDYQGGGTRFIRYNCSMVKPKVGWTTMFPGRVTHLHEGLRTTGGTRYIFVTFVNP